MVSGVREVRQLFQKLPRRCGVGTIKTPLKQILSAPEQNLEKSIKQNLVELGILSCKDYAEELAKLDAMSN